MTTKTKLAAVAMVVSASVVAVAMGSADNTGEAPAAGSTTPATAQAPATTTAQAPATTTAQAPATTTAQAPTTTTTEAPEQGDNEVVFVSNLLARLGRYTDTPEEVEDLAGMTEEDALSLGYDYACELVFGGHVGDSQGLAAEFGDDGTLSPEAIRSLLIILDEAASWLCVEYEALWTDAQAELGIDASDY